MVDICHECGEEYTHVAGHWSRSGCEYKSFSQIQRDAIIGSLMGDGYVSNTNANPYMKIRMTTKKYLQHLSDLFGILSGDVHLEKTAEESASENRDSGFHSDANSENYSDVYSLQTVSHPELREFNDWYNSGEKVWPEDIDLSPTVLKHWYCGDGTWDNCSTNNRVQIAMCNEADNTDKVSKYFENSNIPEPSNYNTAERKSGGMRCSARWTEEDSHELWEYMGEPLPDFEYKWPEEYR